MNRDQYLAMRQDYVPDRLRLIFLCESPPQSGKYFYDVTGEVGEPLFRAMMLDVLKCKPDKKATGLTKFKAAGYFLLDSTYTPVDKLMKAARKRIILKNSALENLIHGSGTRRMKKVLCGKRVLDEPVPVRLK